MTATDMRPLRRSAAAPMAWAGRGLSVTAGTFAAADGIARIVMERSLVPGAAGLDGAEAMTGGVLLAGALLSATGRWRMAGAVVLAFALLALAMVEGRSATPSPDHLLFWLYVAAMAVAGGTLRRSPTHD